MESAPEVDDALHAAELPVERCKRKTREPHWVRVHWTRKPTDWEKEIAAKIKAQIRHGGSGSLPRNNKLDPKCCEPKPADDTVPLPDYDLDAPGFRQDSASCPRIDYERLERRSDEEDRRKTTRHLSSFTMNACLNGQHRTGRSSARDAALSSMPISSKASVIRRSSITGLPRCRNHRCSVEPS